MEKGLRPVHARLHAPRRRGPAPAGRGVARRDQRNLQSQRWQRDVRLHRAALRPQGPRTGLRGGRRPAVHDGCFPE